MPSLTRALAGLTAVLATVTLGSAAARVQTRGDLLMLTVGDTTGLNALRETDALVETLRRAGDLATTVRNVDPLLADRVHERLQQVHAGVPVFGGELTRQTERGVPVSIFGRLYGDIDLETDPALSPGAAATAIARLAGLRPDQIGSPTLQVLPDPDERGRYHLVYQARAFTGGALMVYFVDASTGAPVWAYDDLKRQRPELPCEQCVVGDGLGVKSDIKKISVTTVGGAFLAHDRLRPADIFTFDMRGDWRRTLGVLGGNEQLFDADLAADTDNRWLDGPSVDAHVGMGWTYDYLFHRFGRQGLNAQNVRMISLVHPIDRDDLFTVSPDLIGLFHLNAFYCGLCGPDGVGLAVFGEGLPPNVLIEGRRFGYFSGALDVVAHELAHGLTDFTSALVPLDEPGALNEAFSDIIAVGVEYYAEPFFRDGAGVADYLIGEDAITPGGLRSLADPQRFGDPDHYSLRFVGIEDSGGIHTNSLIATHAYYLAIEGGANRVSGLTVTGVGAENREQMEQIFYRAFTQLLTRLSGFSEARAATIQAARDLYGAGSLPETAVIQAWTAVGVE